MAAEVERKALERAVEEYNKYRSPEAVARLLKLEGDEVLVEFSGNFCRTCGVYDWLEDFVYELQRLGLGLEARMESWRQVSEDSFLVRFRVGRSRPPSATVY